MSGKGAMGAKGAIATGCSLWLMPEGAPRVRLAALIDDLAGRFATPPFAPHLTLLPSIDADDDGEVLDRARVLTRSLPPLGVRLRGVEARDEHFRCVYLKAVADAALVAAHAAAARAFGREPDPAFLPHVSLVYGVLAAGRKRDLARELAAALPMSFDAARLHVWRTRGAPSEWRQLAACELAGRVGM